MKDSEARGAAEAAFFAGWRAEQMTAGIKETRGCQETPSSSSTLEAKKACVARDEKPRDHRDDLRKRNSRHAACGKICHWCGRTACKKRRRPLTRQTDVKDKRATRNYPVLWIGTSTSRWDMDAGGNLTIDDVSTAM